MKSRLLVPAVLALTVIASAGDVQSQSVAGDGALLEALTHLEKASWDAWQKRDGAFFQTFLSPDHVEVGLGGPTSKATVVAGVASPICVVKSYEVGQFALTVFNADTAVLTYHAQQDTTCNGVRVPSPVWTSSLYIKRAGRWQNALYQQTPTTK
jgi:hypothetical protein